MTREELIQKLKYIGWKYTKDLELFDNLADFILSHYVPKAQVKSAMEECYKQVVGVINEK